MATGPDEQAAIKAGRIVAATTFAVAFANRCAMSNSTSSARQMPGKQAAAATDTGKAPALQKPFMGFSLGLCLSMFDGALQ
ncbi:MAG: hypothetical protein N2Z59_09220 [Alteraurantiacibacter sp.]|nr:hypothetical protein [Alteraurantiacibacter sp.]